MRLKLISEVLKGYHIGQMDVRQRGQDSFSAKTKQMYGSTKFYNILSDKLSRLLDHHIIILTGSDLNQFSGGPEETPQIEELSRRTNIPVKDFLQSITLMIISDNYQSQLSPWLLLHQLAEAILQQGFDVWEGFVKPKYGAYFERSAPIDPKISNHARVYGSKASSDMRAFHHLFKFRSAREFRHGDYDNIDPGQEILVEYLWHGGKIRINYPEWIDRRVVDSLKNDIEEWCFDILDKLVGTRMINSLTGDDDNINFTFKQA